MCGQHDHPPYDDTPSPAERWADQARCAQCGIVKATHGQDHEFDWSNHVEIHPFYTEHLLLAADECAYTELNGARCGEKPDHSIHHHGMVPR